MKKEEESKHHFDLVVFTNIKYSDIWKADFSLLRENFPVSKAYIFTDESAAGYENEFIKIISVGKDTSFSDRVLYAANCLKSEYLIFLLDDYLITKPINHQRLAADIKFLDMTHGDYLSYDLSKEKFIDHKIPRGDYLKITNKGVYTINTTPCIWRRSSLHKSVQAGETAWAMEVLLSRRFFENAFTAYVSKNETIPYLDGIRKGTLLPPAFKYLKSRGLYHGSRKITPFKTRLFLLLKTLARKILPEFIQKRLKNDSTSISYSVLNDGKLAETPKNTTS